MKFLYNSQMPKSIGEILKNQRLDRNLALDEAAEGTHIRYKYLEALENNDFELLPSAVQGRGFLRSYAEFLELDPEPLLRGWEQKIAIFDVSEPYLEISISNTTEDGEQSIPPSEKVARDVFAESDIPTQREPQHSADSAQPILTPVELSKSMALFTKVGRTLRNQREILGLSLNDIEQYTHIRQFYLQAIEEGKFTELPSPVQAKGMIENYAQFLDINSDDLLLDYAEALQVQREEKLALNNPQVKRGKTVQKSSKQTLVQKLLTPDLLIGSIVIISIVVFAIWATSRVISNQNKSAEAAIPGISDVLAATTSPSADMVSGNATLQVLTTQTQSSIAYTEPSGATVTAASNPENLEIQATVTSVFQEGAQLQINIVVTQRTYLKVIADGKTIFEGRPQPGNAYPFSANETIEIISGNAAALQIIYNDVDMGVPGSFGEVVDLIFSGGRVLTPTPQFTATATPTSAPTMTLQPTATPATPTVTPYIP